MSRINTNVSSLTAQRILLGQNNGLNGSLERLSTGLRINTGKDDPAGLIASETLRSERRAVGAAITNISRATNVVAVAESGLGEISKLLTDLDDLVTRSSNEAGISDDEREANQLEIDAILDSINRIANSTELQGRKLLNGSLAYTTSNVNSTQLAGVLINSARVPDGGSRNVSVDVVNGAELAQVAYSSGTITSAAVTIEITGRLGAEVLTFGSGTTVSAIAAAVNQSKDLTGVSARSSGSNYVVFNSTNYGSSGLASVRVLTGSFDLVGSIEEDRGADATITVNGVTSTTDGLRASIRSTTLSVDLDLGAAFGSTDGSSSTFQITGGGADFQIAPTVTLAGVASLGIQAVTTGALGSLGTGFLFTLGTGQANDLKSKNFSTAQQIIRQSAEQVAGLRGRLGAFQKDTLETTANSLRVAIENIAAAESSIRDTDFAAETANLTRSQILVQSATNVLRIANQQPQQVLALLQ